MTKDSRQNEIIRIQKKRSNFVMLDKGFLEDVRLSCKAKGILAYLLSKPDNWKVIVGDIVNHCRDGEKAIYSGLRELKECGYYKKIPVRNESGRRIDHWESVIFECPEEQADPEDSSKNIENTGSSLLAGFVQVENVHIQNVDGQNRQRNNNYINKNYLNNNESSQSQRQIEKPKNKSDKTQTPDTDKMTNVHIFEPKIKSTSAGMPISRTYQQTEVPKNSNSDYNIYAELIKANIGYESFSGDDNKLVNSLIETILNVILTENPQTVKIGKETRSRDIVKAVYLKLNHKHIEHVISQYRAQPRKITYKGAYLRTMLFNVYSEFEAAIVNKEAVANFEPQLEPQPVKEKEQKKNRFVNFQQRDIDFAELERLELEQLKASTLDWDHLEQTNL